MPAAAVVVTDADPALAVCQCGIDVSDLVLPGVAALQTCPAGCVAGVVLAVFVAGIDPAQLLSDTQVLDLAVAWDRLTSWTQAHGLRAIAEFARRPQSVGQVDPIAVRAARRRLGDVGRWAPEAEIGPALGLSPQGAERRLASACTVITRFPATLAALAAGRVDAARLTTMISEAGSCPPAICQQVEQGVLADGALGSTAQFRRAVRRAVHRHDPAGAAARADQQRADTYVRTRPEAQDTAILEAYLTADDAAAVRTVLDAAMRTMRAHDGETRTTHQLRSAALVAPFWAALATGALSTPDGPLPLANLAGATPAVTITIDTDGTGDLGGYGVVSTVTTAALAARARTGRHPIVRVKAAYGQADAQAARDWPTEPGYRPTAALARLVRDRDQHCRYPGCSASTAYTDLDHTTPWPDGPTHPTNLAALCRRHHRTKQAPGFTLQQHHDGQLTWTTPTGHVHTTGPPGQTS